MAATLNKQKPFGEICGGANMKYAFEQNHKFFNAAGDEVDKNGVTMKSIEAAKKKAEKDAPKDGGKVQGSDK